MHDEQYMYRVQWPALRQHLYRLCLGCHKHALLDTLCGCGEVSVADRVKTAIDTWRQGILEELAEKTHAADAWPGWGTLLPLLSDTERLYRDIGAMAEEICHEYADGSTSRVWHVLHAYFVDCRDELDGARKTRLQVWRKLNRIRHELNAQRRRQGLGDCQHLPELVAHLLAVIERSDVRDAPTTVEGVLSYFYEFDPIYAQPYDDEVHCLKALPELTDREWHIDLARCLEKLPEDLRQAVEMRFELRPQPVFLNAEDRAAYYGCSDRTLRHRANKALQLLRTELSL